MHDLPENIKAHIDDTLAAAVDMDFTEDPLIGGSLSLIHSFFNSLTRRDGGVIQMAVKEALEKSRFHTVVPADRFLISDEARSMATRASLEDCWHTDMPYGGKGKRKQLDIVVIDHRYNSVLNLEIKRGVGRLGSQDSQSLTTNTVATRMLLKDYVTKLGYAVQSADARVLSYYGAVSVPLEMCVVGAEVDDFLGADVTSMVEASNAYFREKLEGVLGDLLFAAARDGVLPMRNCA